MAIGSQVRIINPYEPLEWQYKPLRDRNHVLLLTGSKGGGKSRCAGEKLHLFCKYYPNAMGLVLRKTRESLTNSTVLFMDREVIGHDPAVRHNISSHRFEYMNGSILAYGGMKDEEQREQIRSMGIAGGVDICWMEEANKFTPMDFNEVLSVMRGRAAPWRQVVLTTNPDTPTHWINTDLIVGKGAEVFYSSAKDNIYNPPEYQDFLNRLTGVAYQRLVLGLWVKAEGVVYEEYNPAVHVINQTKIPPDWRRYRAIDFGYTNPFVCQWWAEDGDGRLYLYREIYRTKLLVEDAAELIISAEVTETSREGKPIEVEDIYETICDHDAEDRATLERHLKRLLFEIKQNQEEHKDQLKKDHLPVPELGEHWGSGFTKAADKRVTAGIQACQVRMRDAGDGKPRVFVMSSALIHNPDERLREMGKPTCTEEEFPTYSWHKGADGKPNKEEPVKDDDHGMDTMRYMVMRLDGKKVKQVLYV